MKKPINQKDLEKDVNRLMSFLNNMDDIDIENTDIDKLEKDIKLFQKEIETKYKNYLDDQE